MVLRRAPLGHRLGLLLIVAGVVVLDDVILAAEEGNHSCGERCERWVFSYEAAAVTHTPQRLPSERVDNGSLLPEVAGWALSCKLKTQIFSLAFFYFALCQV